MLKALLILAILLMLYSCLGILFCRVLQFSCNLTFVPIIGFMLCSITFHTIATPLMLCKVSLSFLCIVYIVILVLGVTLMIKAALKKKKLVYIYDKKEIAIFIILIIPQCVFLFLNMCYGSDWDNCQYVGEMTTTIIFTNTFKQYDPYTGKKIEEFVWQNCFCVYEAHSAVLCRIFNIHPLIYVHRVLANVEIVLANAVLYNIFLILLKGKTKSALSALMCTLVINLYTFSIYSWSNFMFLRTGESKSMLAVVIIPLLIFWFLKITELQFCWKMWFMVLMTAIVGLGIGKSGAFIIPIVITLEALPLIIKVRRLNILLKYFICMIPCGIYVVVYGMSL